jgi:exonuclease III
VEQRDLETIERHANVIQNKLSEIQDLKLSIQELKFEEGKDETDIRNWSAEVDENLKEYQGIGAELKQIVNEMKQEVAEKKDKVEQERRINLEKEIEKIKFEEKLNYESRSAFKGSSNK